MSCLSSIILLLYFLRCDFPESLNLIILARLAGKSSSNPCPTPASAGTTEMCWLPGDFHGFWGFKGRSSHRDSKCFPVWAACRSHSVSLRTHNTAWKIHVYIFGRQGSQACLCGNFIYAYLTATSLCLVKFSFLHEVDKFRNSNANSQKFYQGKISRH